jgi:DNA recombination protein Rad52
VNANITKIVDELNAPLDPKHIVTRNKSGTELAYIEGWHVIAEANRIFGPLNWSRETVSCREVSRDKNAKGNHVIGYEAKVRITVHPGNESGLVMQVVREGTGTGSGIARDIYDAIEGACKEAETDAMKRALMTFGWCMGLALYDKRREHVEDAPPPPKVAKPAALLPALPDDIEKDMVRLEAQLAEALNDVALLDVSDAWRDWVVENSAKHPAVKARAGAAKAAAQRRIAATIVTKPM